MKVNRTSSTRALTAARDAAEARGDWDEAEDIEAELEARDEEPAHEDSPSLQDAGQELGSYAS